MENVFTTTKDLEKALLSGESINVADNAFLLLDVALCGDNPAAREAAKAAFIANGCEWD